MLRNMLRRAASGRLIAGTPKIGLLASQIIGETATGDSGPGLLYNEAQANSGKQLRVKITSYSGTPGKLFVYENGSILIVGESDGSYAIGYDWESWDASGVVGGSDTASVTVGPLNAAAPSATLSGTSTLTPGFAAGQTNSTAPGATLSGVSSIASGSASGWAAGDATAPGANLNGTGTIVSGTATGNQSATAPGANLSGSSAIHSGGANNAMLTINTRYIVKASPRVLTVKAGARNYTVKR